MIEHPVPAMQMDARSPIGASSKAARGEPKDEQRTPGTSKPSFLPEEPRLPLPFWAWRPGGRLPRLVLLLEPAVDEGTYQGTGRNTASEALAA